MVLPQAPHEFLHVQTSQRSWVRKLEKCDLMVTDITENLFFDGRTIRCAGMIEMEPR